ncbi:MAG: class I tRNA ligase family protein [Minisyncoccales bacterium]
MKRTPEVFDCWFESGSMPYAQWHYPFENKELVEKTYPADFIAEGLDQTRGWFYTLHVLATALTIQDVGLGESHPAFKNVIVNGLILDERGRKLSKKLKNYPDPKEMFDSFGADSLRYFLLASTSIGEDYRFSKEKIKEYWRKVISGLENCFAFFETYKKDEADGELKTNNLLDKWIISKTEKLNRDVIKWMDNYELTKASRLFNDYIDDLSNWYIRRSRRRFQKPKNENEKEEATIVLDYSLSRTPEVFDCWFESGSMPYAQWHYPFENKQLVEKMYPADFIAEGLDQTRGWFYTLHVLATALTLDDIGLGKSHGAFKNVIVNGLVLDDKGRKLSKKLKNYPAPDEIFDSFGADALRYFLLASTSIGEDYRFSKDKVKEYWRKVISGIDNCFIFYETYKKESFSDGTGSLLDKWIISKTEKLNRDVIKWMDRYELTKASRLFNDYIDDLSNWYIRRSRRRFQKPESEKEKEEATYTLHYAISKLIKLMAPFTPFITEEIFLKMNGGDSVHLCDYPEPNLDLIDDQLEQEMENVRSIVNLGLAERSKQGIKVRQPLLSLSVKELKIDKELIDLIKEEVNVKEVKEDKKISEDIKLDTTITPELKEEGNIREIIRQIQQMRKDNGFIPEDRINIYYASNEFFDTILERNKEHILREVLADKLILSNDQLKEIKIDNNKIYLNIKKYER